MVHALCATYSLDERLEHTVPHRHRLSKPRFFAGLLSRCSFQWTICIIRFQIPRRQNSGDVGHLGEIFIAVFCARLLFHLRRNLYYTLQVFSQNRYKGRHAYRILGSIRPSLFSAVTVWLQYCENVLTESYRVILVVIMKWISNTHLRLTHRQ